MYIEGLDELDNKIIEVVKENARLTYSEIGEKVEVSRISVKKRMEGHLMITGDLMIQRGNQMMILRL